MNLSELQTFLAIVETGSLVRASERLRVTQSTVTARLKSLEASLGQTLLHRRKSGIELTHAGFRFRRYAEAMTGLWRQARQETSLPEGVATIFKLGCHWELWPEIGETTFECFHREHRQAALAAWPGEQVELDAWLGNGLLDAALCYHPSARHNETIHALVRERIVLVSSRPDSPARFDPHYAYVHNGDDFAREHAAAYADADTSRIHFGSAQWALRHLLANGGSAYLPERLAAPEIASGRLHRLADAPEFSRSVYLVTTDACAGKWPWLHTLARDLAGRWGDPV
ncbi:MAG: LysR family transcriptional regulator [Rhizobiales bacterium]|nr:LysR family transcriptional regulator [Hyphomicrobiales bacterium]